MNMQMLTELAVKGEVRELELLSLEGGFYIARVSLEHTAMTLLDEDAKPMRIGSTTHLRATCCTGFRVSLCAGENRVHDEMCGTREGPIGALRIPFTLAQSFKARVSFFWLTLRPGKISLAPCANRGLIHTVITDGYLCSRAGHAPGLL